MLHRLTLKYQQPLEEARLFVVVQVIGECDFYQFSEHRLVVGPVSPTQEMIGVEIPNDLQKKVTWRPVSGGFHSAVAAKCILEVKFIFPQKNYAHCEMFQ